MIWFLRAISHDIRKSSLTLVNLPAFVGAGFDLENSSANFLHLDAQMRRNLNFVTGKALLGVSGIVNISFVISYTSIY